MSNHFYIRCFFFNEDNSQKVICYKIQKSEASKYLLNLREELNSEKTNWISKGKIQKLDDAIGLIFLDLYGKEKKSGFFSRWTCSGFDTGKIIEAINGGCSSISIVGEKRKFEKYDDSLLPSNLFIFSDLVRSTKGI